MTKPHVVCKVKTRFCWWLKTLHWNSEMKILFSWARWPSLLLWATRGGVGEEKNEVGKEKENFKFFWDCDSLSFSTLECHGTFLSIRYLLLGRKRLIAWDLNCHFMYNTLTDQYKNKPTRNYVLKMYKVTTLTNRELTDSILNCVIKDRNEGAGIVPLVFALILCSWCDASSCSLFKGSGLFLTSGRGGGSRFLVLWRQNRESDSAENCLKAQSDLPYWTRCCINNLLSVCV